MSSPPGKRAQIDPAQVAIRIFNDVAEQLNKAGIPSRVKREGNKIYLVSKLKALEDMVRNRLPPTLQDKVAVMVIGEYLVLGTAVQPAPEGPGELGTEEWFPAAPKSDKKLLG